jgi:hypothetical protein
MSLDFGVAKQILFNTDGNQFGRSSHQSGILLQYRFSL